MIRNPWVHDHVRQFSQGRFRQFSVWPHASGADSSGAWQKYSYRRRDGRHWFRVMSNPHERFCWTTRLCRVMLLRRGLSLS